MASVCRRLVSVCPKRPPWKAKTYDYHSPSFGCHHVFVVSHWYAVHIISSAMRCSLLHVDQRGLAVTVFLLDVSMSTLLCLLHGMQSVNGSDVRHDEDQNQ